MLEKYIERVKNYIKLHPDMSEDEIVRYVYIDLGRRLSFDENFRPFGDSKNRQAIYKTSNYLFALDKCMETKKAICNSMSHILAHVLNKLDITAKVITDPHDFRKTPHVFNLIIPKNDREPYYVDLQEDLYRIQMHGFTTNYGLSGNGRYVISHFEQETMDRKLGYINDENYYTDDYIYTLKTDIGLFQSFKEKVRFVLENIEVYENPNMSYPDRQWYHVRVLEELFDLTEFDYDCSRGKIRIIDCYKEVNNERKYYNVIVVDDGLDNPDIYFYNKKYGKYSKIEFVCFAQAIKNGLIILHNDKIKNLNKVLKNLKTR